MNGDARQARRVELILQQLDELPTLDSVAVRLLDLTASERSRSKDVIGVVELDPALAGKVLRMARMTDPQRTASITTIERAVLHLGFDAVRNIALSVQIFDYFDAGGQGDSTGAESQEPNQAFDREAFWYHSLAVAVLAEGLARAAQPTRAFTPGEGFVAGLLHDLGMLALHVVLPRSFDRVCQIADQHAISIDQACHRMIGVTTHTVGKQLAERWRFPRMLGDVLWLNGQRPDSLPDLPHRPLIAIVSLADLIARAHYTAPPGHVCRGEQWSEMAKALSIKRTTIEYLVSKLPEQVSQRAEAIGMTQHTDQEMLLRCVTRANQTLGRLTGTLRERAVQSHSQIRTLRTIAKFHESQRPGDSVMAVLERVVHSAREYFGEGFFAILHQRKQDEPWQLLTFPSGCEHARCELIDPPAGSSVIAELADSMHISMQVASFLPWLTDDLNEAEDVRAVRLLPLRCGWGVSAVLLHDRPVESIPAQQIEALSRSWAAAIAAGVQHEGARSLGEQLAEANRMLIETQDELSRKQAMAALGEMAAGAAHEMNNPLTVISGRAQQLVDQLTDEVPARAAQQIVAQAHRLSDMITALRMFSNPVRPSRCEVNVQQMLVSVVQSFKPTRRHPFEISVVVNDDLQEVWIDPDLFGQALAELVRNAVESKGSHQIEMRVQIDPADDRLKFQVRDDGAGMTDHALMHAFDPFFSEKAAGRQPGLGLARARRLIEAHGGCITLENNANGGAVATVWLDDWRREQSSGRRRAA